ncbi:hypothetical protein AVHY2522_08235 [Acidovorax sp. SUPP2522]|uniref:hypothetical protein n=1 Tax=unclassified Acidovorax TaxID=2684926 RepID=UPI0023493ACC|nr:MULTISPECIES: hypothetical protein [unclassified Acidovorax]WCM97362.1 hypothetical protein M5C96_23735 [Acidovorax sp. GBBC 1281]GKT15465.1 hypothetical protein AVHY2522_08235 [Acidovorax sp. SUPP2522]
MNYWKAMFSSWQFKRGFMTQRFGSTRLGFFTAAAIFICSSTHAAGTRHTITVNSSPQAHYKWSVYADLYNGKGERVYHWQELNKKPGSSLTWNYTDGNDGGWLHIWVDPSASQRASYLNLPLNKNHCYRITEPLVGDVSVVRDCAD